LVTEILFKSILYNTELAGYIPITQTVYMPASSHPRTAVTWPMCFLWRNIFPMYYHWL